MTLAMTSDQERDARPPPQLDQKMIDALKEVRGRRCGIPLYVYGPFFCASPVFTARHLRVLGAHGLVELMGGRIILSDAGRWFLDGVA